MTADQLKRKRTKAGFTITATAKICNTPRSTYIKWERGERRVPGLLTVTIDWLLKNGT